MSDRIYRKVRVVHKSKYKTSHVLMKDAAKSQQISAFTDEVTALIGQQVIIPPLLDPGLLLSLTEENAIHAACIKALTSDTVGRGWKLIAPLGVDSPEVKAEIQRVKDVINQITPKLSLNNLLMQLVWELISVGYAAWEVVRNENGGIGAIFPVPPQTIFIASERGPDGSYKFVQMAGSNSVYFKNFGARYTMDAVTGRVLGVDENIPDNIVPASEIIFFSQYSPRSPIYGMPHWVAAIPAMAELAAIREYNIGWFESGGMADRLIHVSAKDVKEAESVAEMINQGLSDASGFGHVSLITHGSEDVSVQVEVLSNKEGQREGQFIQRREDLVKEVLMAHQCPPYRVGWAELGPVSKDTEILTENGWKNITEVEVGERVFTLNLVSDLLEIQPVEQTHKHFYTEMIQMIGKAFDALASRDHRMWVFDWEENQWGWMTAGELYAETVARNVGNFMIRTGAECPQGCSVSEEVRRSPRQAALKACEVVPYNDFAYCLTVPNGTLVYRREGKVFIAGNSLGGSAAREMLRAYRMGAVEPLQTIVEDQIQKTLFNPDRGGIPIAFDLKWKLESVDWELVDQNLDIAIRSVQNGILSPASAASLLGFSPPDDPALKEHYLEGVQITSVGGKAPQTESSRPPSAEPDSQGERG